MNARPLTVAWCSYFPVEWLSDAPEAVRSLPKRHPASWLQSGVEEFKKTPGIKLHVLEVSKGVPHNISFDSGGVSFHCLKVPGGWRAPTLFWIDTLVIRKKLKEISPDVLHAWGTERGAALIAARLRYPSLVSVQGLLEYYDGIAKLNRHEQLAARLERVSLRRARIVSGESSFVINWLRAHYPHLQPHHVEHSPGRAFYEVIRRPETKPVYFLAVGTLSYRKGTDLLLLALDRLKEELNFRVTLMSLVHDDAMIAEMKQRTSPGLWERVTIMYAPPANTVAEHLSRATIVLCPTRADTGPVAVKEAVVAGVPVIGSNIGGIPDYVSAGQNGFVFPSDDLDAFTAQIRQACVHPLFSRGLVDGEILKRVREHLSPATMAERFLGIYRQLAPKTRG